MDSVTGIDLSIRGCPSLIMRDLSEYATLPFMAAFDVKSTHLSASPDAFTRHSVPQKRVTYIGLVKKIMPILVELFLRFKENTDIYADGTLEAILSVSILHAISLSKCV